MSGLSCCYGISHYITLQAFGRRSYPERRTTKCITITRNKCVENPREKYRSKCREQRIVQLGPCRLN
uniref:Uncharacterized protein n=1 Tax=Anguilla anguilla TaxID=7936 RepID=A0A0E9Y094_ANGAN